MSKKSKNNTISYLTGSDFYKPIGSPKSESNGLTEFKLRNTAPGNIVLHLPPKVNPLRFKIKNERKTA